jgi:hypothetical protein
MSSSPPTEANGKGAASPPVTSSAEKPAGSGTRGRRKPKALSNLVLERSPSEDRDLVVGSQASRKSNTGKDSDLARQTQNDARRRSVIKKVLSPNSAAVRTKNRRNDVAPSPKHREGHEFKLGEKGGNSDSTEGKYSKERKKKAQTPGGFISRSLPKIGRSQTIDFSKMNMELRITPEAPDTIYEDGEPPRKTPARREKASREKKGPGRGRRGRDRGEAKGRPPPLLSPSGKPYTQEETNAIKKIQRFCRRRSIVKKQLTPSSVKTKEKRRRGEMAPMPLNRHRHAVKIKAPQSAKNASSTGKSMSAIFERENVA